MTRNKESYRDEHKQHRARTRSRHANSLELQLEIDKQTA